MARTVFTACLCAGCLSAITAESSPIVSSFNTSLIDTSQNQACNSEPMAFEPAIPAQKPLTKYFKLASVHFITDNYRQLHFGDLIFNCNDGWHLENGACAPNSCDGFPYAENPTAVCNDSASCLSGDNYKYACHSCKDGWDSDPLQKGMCAEHLCDTAVYPYSVRPDSGAGTIITCQSGNSNYYGYENCFEGWSLSAGKCMPDDCSGFPFQSIPDETAGLVSEEICRSGYDNYYKYASCNKGWEMAEGKCNLRVCDNAVYPNTECPPNADCNVCFSGNEVKYAEPSCYSGYELKDGICVESCKYTSTSTPSYCTSALSCLKGETTYYGCQSCQDGWFVNSSYGCSPNVCSGYDTSGSYCNPQYGTYSKSCQSGYTTYCSYSSCNNPFVKQNGMCLCGGSYAMEQESVFDFVCRDNRGTIIKSCSDARKNYCSYSACDTSLAKYNNGRCECYTATDLADSGYHKFPPYRFESEYTDYCNRSGNIFRKDCNSNGDKYSTITCNCPEGTEMLCDVKNQCYCAKKIKDNLWAGIYFASSSYNGSYLLFGDYQTPADCKSYCQNMGGIIIPRDDAWDMVCYSANKSYYDNKKSEWIRDYAQHTILHGYGGGFCASCHGCENQAKYNNYSFSKGYCFCQLK